MAVFRSSHLDRDLPPATEKISGMVFRAIFFGTLFIATGVVLWELIAVFFRAGFFALALKSSTTILDIAVLVFREGLECVLVLAAITGGVANGPQSGRKPIAVGALLGLIATVCTWLIAVDILNDLSKSISALTLQAATGLLAVIVLLVVMNWFFHKLYWTGWISTHNKRKRELLEGANRGQDSRLALLWGMGLLGFTSFYREGFEVVLFLQSFRLKLGNEPVLLGVSVGVAMTAAVAALTFIAHRKLPYRKMLILTGILLGVVLVVMVGEQAQEMQQAHWISTTTIPWLAARIPSWMELWFAIFPTVETVLAQTAAVALVLGSYILVNRRSALNRSSSAPQQNSERAA